MYYSIDLMYSKKELADKQQKFWTAFGQYMRPVPSAFGDQPNWVNYKTGFRHIYFRLDAGRKGARVAIEITHKDPEERMRWMGQLKGMRGMIEATIGHDWIWEDQVQDEDGRVMSCIYKELPDADIMLQDHWPVVIAFLKDHIIRLDACWAEIRDILEAVMN